MQQAGRKSTAALSVVAGSIDGRPSPPGDLTKRQREIWARTVSNEAAEMFRTAACQQLLSQYCRHAETAERLEKTINAFLPEWTEEAEGLTRYDRLLKMRDRETRAMSGVATKLRITNQSRYDAKTAATAANKAATERRPWQVAG